MEKLLEDYDNKILPQLTGNEFFSAFCASYNLLQKHRDSTTLFRPFYEASEIHQVASSPQSVGCRSAAFADA